MARQTPLLRLHEQAEAAIQEYAAADGISVPVVSTFGEFELEYAAIRKHAALIDQPNRGVIELTGRDRLEFLQRMITQDMKGMQPFHVRRAFWLNRKGRIESDLRVIDLPSRTLIDLDVHAAKRTAESLLPYVITEDVNIRDVTDETHRLAIHGPRSMELLRALAQATSGSDASGPAFGDLERGRACVIRLANHNVVVDRDDSTGSPGLELIVQANAAEAIWLMLIEEGADPTLPGARAINAPAAPTLASRVRLRAIGWHAYNVARIEAGRPIFPFDFGTDALPAETGMLDDRVSFKKGCYLGQEVVARMHSLGSPKRVLTALIVESSPRTDGDGPRQPVSGSFVSRTKDDGTIDAVGVITSSCVSPLRGGIPICFAQIKTDHAKPGNLLSVDGEGSPLKAVVQPRLSFISADPGVGISAGQ